MKTIYKLIFTFSVLLALTACSTAEPGEKDTLGNADAPVLIEEFSDYQCPACANISPQLEAVVKRNPDIARFNYYHFPLSQHQRAFPAAEAAECANDQGKFWEYSAFLFKNQNNLTDDAFKSFADKLKLDRTAFDECLESGSKKSMVKADLYEGRRRKVSYTPSIFVNGQLLKWPGAEQFEVYLKTLK